MAKQATAKQRARWEELRSIGCMVATPGECYGGIEVHHCFTGAGGRKDHDKVIPLCSAHHRGKHGIHTLMRKKWQELYGTEADLMREANDRLQSLT